MPKRGEEKKGMQLPGGVRVQNNGARISYQTWMQRLQHSQVCLRLYCTDANWAWQVKSHWKTTHEHFKQAKHCDYENSTRMPGLAKTQTSTSMLGTAAWSKYVQNAAEWPHILVSTSFSVTHHLFLQVVHKKNNFKVPKSPPQTFLKRLVIFSCMPSSTCLPRLQNLYFTM